MARVRAALDAIPYKIGSSVGTETEPTAAAVRLLSPNRILERRYIDPATGLGFSLLVVHCGDARDMDGHFPPVCYPAHGWKLGTSHVEDVMIGNEHAQVRVYEFARRDDLIDRRMQVLDFFVLPHHEEAVLWDSKAVERASRSSDVAGLGVAQFQLVMGDEMPEAQRDVVTRDVLQAITPAIQIIGQGI
jgi:hypothetical protein